MDKFEWDENKRELNIQKHGIDFVGAVRIFDDPYRIEIENSKKGETRYQVIAAIDDIIIFLVYAYRNPKRRIISARRANHKERKIYYQMR